MNKEIPMLNGKPQITNSMKQVCHGEFFVEIELTCSACFYDEPQEECEVCGGEIAYTQTHVIPWTTVKDIYKQMVTAALND